MDKYGLSHEEIISELVDSVIKTFNSDPKIKKRYEEFLERREKFQSDMRSIISQNYPKRELIHALIEDCNITIDLELLKIAGLSSLLGEIH